jgi:hypothetical protein
MPPDNTRRLGPDMVQANDIVLEIQIALLTGLPGSIMQIPRGFGALDLGPRGLCPTKMEVRNRHSAPSPWFRNFMFLEDRLPKKSRRRPKPGADNLSISQLEAIAKYLGYSLVCLPGSADLVDCRTSYIVARGGIALNHLRSLYVERDLAVLADIPELRRASSPLAESPRMFKLPAVEADGGLVSE